MFGDFVDRIYTIELAKLDTTDTDTDTNRSASDLDLHLEIDSEERLKSTRRGAQFVPIGMPTVC
jgi:hypothetical protein